MSISSISTINVFGGIRTTNPGVTNTQAIPLSKVNHTSPSNIGVAAGATPVQLTAYQLMNGALTGAPTGGAGAPYIMPTAANILAAYSGSKQRIAVGDVLRINVVNTSTGTGMSIGVSAGGVVSTGATGTLLSLGAGPSEAIMHINWLAVSTDGTTGVYQLF